ncbi:hypothetical protein SAMN04488137_0614 [Fictibacillus solisalsi]|uniref:Uncharacterized protein n=1 Tax=Fictibacillus solisalsi TaxID=459525 RepID=A0A1G9U072_9BACL|nr:hypothetical protein [Fictibacillus solisalsi]SDM53278.1 hypothetical protein SAMN04488137_0614 [Fictibacillus solisalsi]
MNLFNKPIVSLQEKATDIRMHFPATSWIVFVSLVSAIAALLQSAGGTIPVAGMCISPFSTLPVIVMTLISLLYGLYTYTLTIILLVIIQPAEVLIFTFTTGMLGIGLGLGFNKLKRRLFIALSGCIFLFFGMCIMLYGLSFPLFGADFPYSRNSILLPGLFLFSLAYSFGWTELTLLILKKRWNIK